MNHKDGIISKSGFAVKMTKRRFELWVFWKMLF